MQTQRDALSATHRGRSAIETGKGTAKTFPLGRLLAAVLLGLILLGLSALIHAAAAAPRGAGWPSLGATWFVAIIVILLAVHGARTGVVAWRRMCLIDGVASLGLVAAGAVDLVDRGTEPYRPPFGPVFGVAYVSGIVAIAGFALAVAFFVAWFLLARHGTPSDKHT
ncbi:MAG TPA: hypothetical protein VMU87_20590 [Stellaceae bacterium]|nr:hypothetical protein [Stellaceae bacterium]